MNKKFQIFNIDNGVKVIVRYGNGQSKQYENISYESMHRLEKLLHDPLHCHFATTAIYKNRITLFIQRS